MKRTVNIFWIICEAAVIAAFIYAAYSFGKKKRPYDFEEATTIESLEISAKYERLLDSTAKYIYQKYGEFLPDTYWEGDIYTDIYDDLDCWDRNYLKSEK